MFPLMSPLPVLSSHFLSLFPDESGIQSAPSLACIDLYDYGNIGAHDTTEIFIGVFTLIVELRRIFHWKLTIGTSPATFNISMSPQMWAPLGIAEELRNRRHRPLLWSSIWSVGRL